MRALQFQLTSVEIVGCLFVVEVLNNTLHPTIQDSNSLLRGDTVSHKVSEVALLRTLKPVCN